MDKYTYLFPFEQVPLHSNIVIYGAGDVGREYYVQLQMTGYGHIVCFLDQNWNKYAHTALPVYPPAQVRNIDFDFIVVALKSDVYLRDIVAILTGLGVDERKIVFSGLRGAEPAFIVSDDAHEGLNEQGLAYHRSKLSLALKLGPGYGDAIIKKAFFQQMVQALPGVAIDVYSSLEPKLFYSVYRGAKGLNCYVRDAGAAYLEYSKYYTVALQAPYLLHLDKVAEPIEQYCVSEAAAALRRLVQCCREYNLGLSPVELNRVHFERMALQQEH
ncbi:MAG: hypothetical protein PUI26_08145, partial [Selenomonadaceae bacterium]|nr:hypothetical protein [Selenomonadaceae bacterium]